MAPEDAALTELIERAGKEKTRGSLGGPRSFTRALGPGFTLFWGVNFVGGRPASVSVTGNGKPTKIEAPKDAKAPEDEPAESPALGDEAKKLLEEAKKMAQLKAQFGDEVEFILFLCGYVNAGYLGYEAADGMDWVWEHRIGDIDQLGI